MPGIREWFSGETVLITGGTGFLGQSLIYKLLQIGCPKIFVLIRPRKGRSSQQRLDDMVNRYTFDSLRDTVDIPSKLIAISCDSNAVGLGISEEHLNILQDEVSVVFHGAASVKFDDPLKVAVFTNLRMTRDVADLAKGMKKLKIFSYISTAYANCEYMLNGVEERLYAPKMDWRSVIKAAETMPDEMLNSLEQKLLGASPNTYIFTKHLTESLVNDYNQHIPVVIVRPPVVIGSLKEPEPGWVSNLNSPLAMVVASGKGVLRLFFGPSDSPKAYVPTDIVVNGTLAITWHQGKKQSKEVTPVYNTNYFGTPARKLIEGCYEANLTVPMKDGLWYRRFHCIPNRHMFLVLHLLVHFLPGLFVDGLLKINGRKPMLTRIYRKMYVAFVLLRPFVELDDFFHTSKFQQVAKSIPEEEKSIFYLDMDWSQNFLKYLQNAGLGYRAFAGEPTNIQEKEYAHQKRLYYLDLAATYAFYMIILWFIPYSFIFSCISGAFYNFITSFDVSDL